MSTEIDYTNMNNTQLKKLMTERKINGRSKIVKKQDMINALTAFDSGEEIVIPEKEKKPRVPKLNSEEVKKLLTEALAEFESNIEDVNSEDWQLFKEKLMKAAEVQTKKKAPRKKKDENEGKKSRKSKKNDDKEKNEKKEKKSKKKETTEDKENEINLEKESNNKKNDSVKEHKKKSATEKMIEIISKTPQKKVTSKDLVIKNITRPSDFSTYQTASITELRKMLQVRGLDDNKTTKVDMVKALIADDMIKNMRIKNERTTEEDETTECDEPQEE
jgi:hypothetical protein